MSYPSRWWMDGGMDGHTPRTLRISKATVTSSSQRDCLGVCEWAAAGVGVSACGTG